MARCTPERIAAWAGQRDAQVLVLSAELEPAARYFARVLGARLMQTDDGISAEHPLYVFGKPQVMTNRTLTTLRDQAERVSFLPAIDLAGASFIAAKLILASLMDKPAGYLCGDAIFGSQADFSPLITGPDAEDELGTVIVQAHGDGAHANLGSVVLCGRVGEVEQLFDGNAIHGCEQRADGAHCKRRGPKHAGICALQDLRARQLVLLTCNSFTIGDGQYPSTSNLVVAALEGYASSVVATHASYILNPAEIALVEAAARDGVAPAQLYLKLRALHRQLGDLDPFVYAGLIQPEAQRHAQLPGADEAELAAEQELESALIAWQDLLTGVGQRFIEHLSALQLIRRKEQAQATEPSANLLAAYEAHTASYTALLQAFHSEAEAWRLKRAGRENALRLLHQVIQQGKECDASLAKSLLWRFRNSDYTLGEFGKRKGEWKNTQRPCASCGNDLFKTVLRSFLFPNLTGHRMACLTCGAFEVALPAAGKLSLSAKTTWQRGDRVPISASLRPTGRSGSLWEQVGWGAQFGFHITHYGHAPYLSTLVEPPAGADAAVEFVCPADMHPDIYSITVAAMLGGQISIKRIRTRCL
ncbi:hypothetical protein [Dyella acidiphila]|uniref:Uncharacterized protein n=1 Tax=Dyella acidiphila TaxID=2775866 RepID=A0ABR9G761_9GAMM|nr:hypothetical protein [Dyella acidiphila]MBE1159880.1 hypothetical protein [Dyella acidiphila]